VKTRLTGALEPGQVCRLYRLFVEDLLAGWPVDKYDTTICYDPPDGERKMMTWLGPSFHYQPQQGSSLGEKMKRAFLQAFAGGAKRVVLIGSDIPDLDAGIIDAAFAGLETHDGVLGPAVDGGYYLIGFAAESFCPAIFRDIAWGSSHVFEDTLNRMTGEKLTVQMLTPWQDIDTVEDLRDLLERVRRRPQLNKLKTVRYLAANPELLEA
jgi:rSAM/selenodomain-associated transferase 1